MEEVNLVCWALVGNAVYFYLAIDHHARYHAGACWRIFTKVFPEYLVERLEIACVIKPHAATHYVLRRVARFCQDGQKIPDSLMGLGNDVARDHFTFDHWHLAGDIQPAVGLYCASKWQLLASGPFAPFSAVALYAHAVNPRFLY